MTITNLSRVTNSRRVTARRQGTNNYGRSAYGKDEGQRFEIRYSDGLGDPHVWGWTNDITEVVSMELQIEEHPVFHSPRVIDRLNLNSRRAP